jgi:hypothetical protein
MPNAAFVLLPVSKLSIQGASAGVTQLVECKLPMLDVAGSNPVSRSQKTPCALAQHLASLVSATAERAQVKHC